MKEFFDIQTPYSSKDYEMLKKVVNMGIDSHLEGFTKSEFKKSPYDNGKFMFNFHVSELPLLFRRLDDLYEKTGDDDYESLKSDIETASDAYVSALSGDMEEMDEMLNPYDPMDANQTLQGEPAGNSDLEGDTFTMGEAELREMIKRELGTMQGESLGTLGLSYTNIDQGIENFIDDDTKAQELAAESSSDSLANAHGMNAKPETLDEAYGDRYEQIVFMQGHEADEAMDILNNDGEEAAMEYLKQWHYPGEHDGSDTTGKGTMDKTFEKDGYTMMWNPYLPYIGLVYDTEYQAEPVAEDSQVLRHRVDQRQKDVPLGQHSPHSQATIKERGDDEIEIKYSAF